VCQRGLADEGIGVAVIIVIIIVVVIIIIIIVIIIIIIVIVIIIESLEKCLQECFEKRVYIIGAQKEKG
jgi:hypothetical protein